MKLLTHNMLCCHAKGCDRDNFPLRLENISLEKQDVDFNADLMRSMLSKLEWSALVAAATSLDLHVPATLPDNARDDEEFLRNLHAVIMETNIKDGQMVCPRCSHVYVIREGIPNMLLQEDEV